MSELAKRIANGKPARAFRAIKELYGDDVPSDLRSTKISKLHAKVTGNIQRGSKIIESAENGGNVRAKQIKEKHGGKSLEDREEELKKRLDEYITQGHSRRRACQILSSQKDVFWTAEYLRKKLPL